MAFDIGSIRSFRFVSYGFDERRGIASFRYAFDDGPHFEEQFIFPAPATGLRQEERAALDVCLRHLFLVAGVSYYKAAIPPRVVIEGFDIPQETAHFLEKLYVNGLGEFAYRNGLDLRGRIRFPYSRSCRPVAHDIELVRRSAVPVGGGKDSVVTLEALRFSSEPVVLCALGSYKPIRDVARQAGIPLVTVGRKLSPALFELNSRGALNGHVPISAIIAFTLPVLAIIHGFDTAVLSNEKSASVGNLTREGFEVNHQYSKGLEFERDVSAFFKTSMLTGFRYFSLLRPLSELAIARLFARCSSYHSIFTSCNAAFRIDENRRGERWCLKCPKCRFTFLALAPFMKKEKLIGIFGANLLDSEEQAPGFDELLGFGAHKPFECVGEIDECVAALFMISRMPDWRGDRLVRRYADLLLREGKQPEVLIERALRVSGDHLLPGGFEEMLHAYSGTAG